MTPPLTPAPLPARDYSSRWTAARNQFGDDVIALTVADMDLTCPPQVLTAVAERASNGFYGYTIIPDTYYQAVQNWLRTRHDWQVNTDDVVYTHRVVEAVSVILEEFTDPGDGVLIHTPSYGPVTNLIEPAGRKLITSPLIKRAGRYEVDFEETSRILRDEAGTLILFSPHNPTGRVWTRDELTRFAALAAAHNTLIISDDVHADLVHPGYRHIPIGSLDQATADRTITLTSPGKPFNLAGLEISNTIITNPELRRRFTTRLEVRGVGQPSFFAVPALEAAYGHGGPWLDRLMQQVNTNLDAVREFTQTVEGVTLVEPEGTYLGWLDCTDRTRAQSELLEWMRRARVLLTPGTAFGKGYQGFLRINLAVPGELLETALERLTATA